MNDTTTHHAALSTQPSDHVAEELHRYDEQLRTNTLRQTWP